jgi:hypothetical protein
MLPQSKDRTVDIAIICGRCENSLAAYYSRYTVIYLCYSRIEFKVCLFNHVRYGASLSTDKLKFVYKPAMTCGGVFMVSVAGQIESAEFHDIDNIYCKYCFVYGPDWVVTSVRPFSYFSVADFCS